MTGKSRDSYAGLDDLIKKVDSISFYWLKWNTKQITSAEFITHIEKILKTELKKEWQRYLKNPLRKLLV